MQYDITVTVQVSDDDESYALRIISEALKHARLGEIIHIDSEVTASRLDEDEEPAPSRRLTRNERLQGLADRGCDTWEEYRGDR